MFNEAEESHLYNIRIKEEMTHIMSYQNMSVMQGEVSTSGRTVEDRVREAVDIRDLLRRNTEEADGVLRALNGEYVLPEAGGDLLRDGAGVLPTGA